MAVYLFTLHAYRTWNADRSPGFVKQGQGVQAPSQALARYYDRVAKDDPVLLSDHHQRVILWIVGDACRRRSWRLHFVATDPTHVHILVSWKDFQPWEQVRAKLKNVISWALSQEFESHGRSWLAAKGSRKRVVDRTHFDYLVKSYLPGHRGLCWCEGEPPPVAPNWSTRFGRGTA